MRDKNNNILKIGDTIKNNAGLTGKLVNHNGKSYFEHSGGRTLLSEIDMNLVEKVA